MDRGENSQEVTLAEEEEEAVRLFTVLWQSLCTQRYLVGLTDMLPISLACCCYHCRGAHNMATGLFRMNQGDEEFTVLLVHCCTCTRQRANFKYKDHLQGVPKNALSESSSCKLTPQRSDSRS